MSATASTPPTRSRRRLAPTRRFADTPRMADGFGRAVKRLYPGGGVGPRRAPGSTSSRRERHSRRLALSGPTSSSPLHRVRRAAAGGRGHGGPLAGHVLCGHGIHASRRSGARDLPAGLADRHVARLRHSHLRRDRARAGRGSADGLRPRRRPLPAPAHDGVDCGRRSLPGPRLRNARTGGLLAPGARSGLVRGDRVLAAGRSGGGGCRRRRWRPRRGLIEIAGRSRHLPRARLG